MMTSNKQNSQSKYRRNSKTPKSKEDYVVMSDYTCWQNFLFCLATVFSIFCCPVYSCANSVSEGVPQVQEFVWWVFNEEEPGEKGEDAEGKGEDEEEEGRVDEEGEEGS